MTLFLVFVALVSGAGCGWAAGRRAQQQAVRVQVLQQMEADRVKALRAGLAPPSRPRIRSAIRSPRQASAPPARKNP